MEKLLVENEDELIAALASDLGKPAIEGWVTDLKFTRGEITLQPAAGTGHRRGLRRGRQAERTRAG